VLVWECTGKQAGCVPSSASGSVLGSMPGSVLENILGALRSVLRAHLVAYSQVGWGWECVIECNWACT